MLRFKVGDVVYVRKPVNIHQWPVWIPAMDVYVGQPLTISSAMDLANNPWAKDNSYRMRDANFTFSEKWLSYNPIT